MRLIFRLLGYSTAMALALGSLVAYEILAGVTNDPRVFLPVGLAAAGIGAVAGIFLARR